MSLRGWEPKQVQLPASNSSYVLGVTKGARFAPDSPLRTLAVAARAQYEDACQRIPTLLPTAPAAAQPAVPDPDQQERLCALGYVD